MATLTLLPNETWFKPSVSTVTKSTITTINIVDSYSPTENLTDSWDASEDTDGSVMVYVEGGTLTIAGNGSGMIYANADSSKAFNSFGTLTVINGTNLLDVSRVINMERMFFRCYALTAIDTSNWNTGNVTSMTAMFSSCNSLSSIDVSKWDTSKVTYMQAIFNSCTSLSSIDVSSWNTSKVTDMQYLFHKCPLISINTTEWKTGEVTNMDHMFNECTSLSSIDVSKWDTSKVTNMKYMFNECTSLSSIDVSKWNTSNVTYMQAIFNSCNSLSSIDVSSWNTSKVTNMEFMFSSCNSLSSIDVSKWNTSEVTSMKAIFQNCTSLSSIDVSSWNTSKVTNLSWAFYKCSSLKSIDVSEWNTGNVTNMRHLFTHNTNLSEFDVSNWNMEKVTSIDGFFHSTKKKVYDISKWNTSNCLTFAQLFESCSNAEQIIGLDQIDTSKGKRFTEMFNGCSKLASLDLSNFDMRSIDDTWSDPDLQDSGVNATVNMLNGLTSLKVLKLGQYCNLRDNSALSDPSPDNYWYAESTGIRYKSANIPQGVAETYLADSPEVLIKSSSLYKIADAIREATGSSDTIKVSEMGNLIQGNIVTTLNEISAGITNFEFTSTPESIDPQFFAKCTNLKNIYCTWEENAIEGAPWGAPETATIWYEGGQPDFES